MVPRSIRVFSLCLLAAGLASGAEKPVSGVISNGECLVCHADAALAKEVAGQKISLEIKAAGFTKSVHGQLSCQDCHPGIKELPHPEKLPPAQCASCHEDSVKAYVASIHGVRRAAGVVGAAACADCHGTHYITPIKQETSPVNKVNLPATCSRCHSNSALLQTNHMSAPDAAAHYMESLHGRALLKLGLTAAPSCSDCHGSHAIRRKDDPVASIHHNNVTKTCGKCHTSTEKAYRQSIHGQLLTKGDTRGPVCTDCHSAHEIQALQGGSFKATSDARCGVCHQDRLKRYHETYHGKALALGTTNHVPEVATCYDCHGHHTVFRVADPRSQLSSSNILQTCRQCHAGASQKFTQYIPHADPLDGKNYPALHAIFIFMTCLLIGVFTFFGLHTALWLYRSGRLYFRDRQVFKAVKDKAAQDEENYTRFSPFERLLHMMVVTSFLLLVITGMPLKFHYTAWARTFFDMCGGIQLARLLHRLGAVITFLYFALHLMDRVACAWRGRRRVLDPETGRFSWRRWGRLAFGPDSMVPGKRDWDEFVAHVKWFVGRGPRPQLDRWTYWERFDYMAVFWGVAMIGVSGLILWFPVFFTHFLPGWAINIALIIHSDEALLAAGFIFAFHFFNTHFRPEKFPMDTVIFSGRISKTEFLHERRRWYDRLVAEGRVEEYRVKDEWPRWKAIARFFGFLFFGVGVILLIVIIVSMYSHMKG